MSHPATLKELFEHIRHYEPKIYVLYEQWFNDAIARYDQRQPSVPIQENAIFQVGWNGGLDAAISLLQDLIYENVGAKQVALDEICGILNAPAAPEPK